MLQASGLAVVGMDTLLAFVEEHRSHLRFVADSLRALKQAVPHHVSLFELSLHEVGLARL